MKKILTYLESFFGLVVGWGLLYLLWLILFREVSTIILVSGVFATGLVVYLFFVFELSIDIPGRSLARPLLWLKFLAFLVVEVVKSTLRTCFLILTGDVKGRIVAYDTQLESGTGKLFLLNSITLTPITIGILSEENLVYIHHLHLEGRDDYRDVVDKIRSTFEEPLLDLMG